MSASKPEVVRKRPSWSRYGWLAAGGAVLLVAAGVAFFPGCGRADGDELALVQRFGLAAGKGTGEAEYLGPKAAFDDEPVSEEEAEARYADWYLRQPALQITKVSPGEPDRDGKLKPAAHRYTLATKVEGSTPPLRVRNRAGEVEAPARLFIMNPLIVVEVKGGKIHGVRVECNPG